MITIYWDGWNGGTTASTNRANSIGLTISSEDKKNKKEKNNSFCHFY